MPPGARVSTSRVAGGFDYNLGIFDNMFVGFGPNKGFFDPTVGELA